MNFSKIFTDRFKKLRRFFFTIRHLKFIQIKYRLIYKVKSKSCKGEIRYKVRYSESFIKFPELLTSPYMGDKTLKFLNETGFFYNWNCKNKEKLWLYNLHYFDDLNSLNSDARISFHQVMINDWIKNNPPFYGNGWEPYPMSLRIVNLVKYYLKNNKHNPTELDSLFLQAKYLLNSLEYHLLGNHILANAKALIFAGVFFEGDESDLWLNKGLSILETELNEQILSDGGNFELSPMYHNIILFDLLDLMNLAKSSNLSIFDKKMIEWNRIARSMLTWSKLMSHCDGEVSFFNDSAIGISPNISSLLNYANQLEVNLKEIQTDESTGLYSLLESGYIIFNNNRLKAILDVGNIGPDYLPGHAHADSLSFEISMFNQRVFVNSGTSVYGLSDERIRQRKTSSHNTIEVDGEDSSEVWSGFRVARRAYTSKPKICLNGNNLNVSCSHDGYSRLKGKVTHERDWLFSDDSINITDRLSGSFSSATAHYHIHPSVDVRNESGVVVLKLESGQELFISSNENIEVVDSTWHPEFGVSIPNKKLIINLSRSQLDFHIRY